MPHRFVLPFSSRYEYQCLPHYHQTWQPTRLMHPIHHGQRHWQPSSKILEHYHCVVCHCFVLLCIVFWLGIGAHVLLVMYCGNLNIQEGILGG